MASHRTASPYICAIGSASGSSSDATRSWLSARSHCPSTHRSWNRKTRSFASAGRARTSSCSRASAAAGSPSFRLRSAASESDMRQVLARVPLVFETGAPQGIAVRPLGRVLDADLVEREGDFLEQRRGARLVSSLDVERHDAPVLDLDLEVLQRELAGLADGQHR